MKLLVNRLIIITVILLCARVDSVQAVEVQGLYESSVGVADQRSTTRSSAVLTGFKEVLIRKSGSERVLDAYEVKQSFRKVTAFLQRFEYIPNDSASNSQQASEYPFNLKMHFEPRLVDELIQTAGMPIWGSNRPVTILWLAVEENFNRQLVKENPENSFWSDLISEEAKRRGLPVILPLMDLEDELNVTLSDVWGRFLGPVNNASERYQADSVLVGRIYQVGDTWQSKLTYLNQSEQQAIEIEAPTPQALVASLSNRLAEQLCAKYCVVESADTLPIKLQISGVKNFKDFKQVQQFLEGLSSIRKVELEQVAGTHARFNIALLGELQSVIEGIELSNKLIQETAPSVDPFQLTESGSTDQSFSALSENNHVLAEPEKDESLEKDSVNVFNKANASLKPLPLEQETMLYFRWVE
ncbi:DUF2066 domain-containing protein [Aliikangiella sp. IMCC44632]